GPEAEQRHVADRRFPGALPPQQRGRDAPRDRQAAEHVTESGALVHWPLDRGVLERHREAGAGPERRTVEPAAVLFRTACALARPADVDDVRVPRPDLVDVDAEALPQFGEEARDEDVGSLDQLVEQL